MGREPAVQQVLRPRHAVAASPSRSRRSRSPCSRMLDDKWADYSVEFIRRMAGDAPPVVPLPRHPRRPLRQLPARAVPRVVAGEAPVQGHDRRARRHRRPARRRARGDRPARAHDDPRLVRQRARDGDLARLRLHAVPLREGLDLGRRRARAGHRVLARDDRRRSDERRPVRASPTCCRPCCALAGAADTVPDRPLHRRRRPDLVPARARRRCRTASTSTTGCCATSPRSASASTSSCWRRRATTTPTCRAGRLHRGDAAVHATGGSTTSTWIPRSSAAT